MAKNISYLYALFAAFLWGSTAGVVKLLLLGLGNLQVLFFTNLFAFFGLASVVFFQKKKAIIQTYTKRDYITFIWMGFLGTFLYTFFLFTGLGLLPAQEAFIINYLWPVMVVIFAALILKEKITGRKIFAIACSFFGIIIVITKGNFESLQFSNLLGAVSAALGALVWGIFSVLGKKQNYEGFTSMMFFYLFGTLFAFIAVLLFSSIPHISLQQFAGLLWLGVFVNGLAFVFWFLALKHGDTAKIANIIFLTPFLSLLYIYFLTGEQILVSSIVGLVVIVAGNFISLS